jgi:hypothetical protein
MLNVNNHSGNTNQNCKETYPLTQARRVIIKKAKGNNKWQEFGE